ncbi:hypothetical protein Shyhy01_47480 [Streptomyces hygroscopicus subsp. hygroscopicus]|nr:hypothetical protein Shyhy01_47480 [Streptomyces hygroscopicus subsp. hygroscopicus]
MFSDAVYDRGAMTLQVLRESFFGLLPVWIRLHRHGDADTADFVRLAERTRLGDLFDTWLFTRGKPAL